MFILQRILKLLSCNVSITMHSQLFNSVIVNLSHQHVYIYRPENPNYRQLSPSYRYNLLPSSEAKKTCN